MDYVILNNLHIIIIFAIKLNRSGILTFSLSCLIFISFFFWGLFFFFFFDLFFSKSFDLSFRTFTLFSFIYLFSNMGKKLAESKVCTYLQDCQSQFKNYEPYYYRTLTVAPHGDGISWWNVKNFKTSSLWILTVMALEMLSELCNYSYLWYFTSQSLGTSLRASTLLGK